MAVNNIDCAQALKRLIEFIDLELADADRDVIERHLQPVEAASPEQNSSAH